MTRFADDRREMDRVKAERLDTRAGTLHNIRRALIDITEGAEVDGWPGQAITFAAAARQALGNAEAVLRATIEDLRDPVDLAAPTTGDVALVRRAGEVVLLDSDDGAQLGPKLFELADRLADWLGGR